MFLIVDQRLTNKCYFVPPKRRLERFSHWISEMRCLYRPVFRKR